MGKVHAIFNFSIAVVITTGKKAGVTPKHIEQIFGNLPGETTIESIYMLSSLQTGQPLCDTYKVVVNNDVLPDGTEVTAKYKRSSCVADNGSVQFFDVFQGIDFIYPQPISSGNLGNIQNTLSSGQPIVTGPITVKLSSINGGLIGNSIPLQPTPSGAIGSGSNPRCSCGAQKVGSSSHSNWCDMATIK